MNNPFGFALAGAKEFFLGEVSISNLKIQNWMFFALTIAVVILILVIVSAVKHSKKNKKETAEEESVATATTDETTETTDETTITADETETDNTTDNTAETTETATADGEETVTDNTEETETTETTEITETTEETITAKTAEAPVTATEETTDSDGEETSATVTAETTESETAAEPETTTEETTATEEETVVTAEEPTTAEETAVTAEETSATEETATTDETASAEETTTTEETTAVEETAPATTEKPETVVQKPVKKTTKPVVKNQRETKNQNTEEDNKMKPTKTKVTKNADLVFGNTSSDKVDLSAEKTTTRKKKTAAPEEKPVVEEVAATKPSATVTGKFEICNSSIGGFRYHLLANNGQLLYVSRDYKTYDSCADAIQKFINSVANGEFTVRADKFGNYKYHLKSATSNNIIYVGIAYSTKKSCLNSVESVKRFTPVSPIVNATDPEFKATAAPFAIPDDVVKAVKNKQGAVGKWVIDHADSADENSDYVFLLYANNGQLLYESREFSSYANCRKGIDTFVSTLENGYFIVDEDKFGRFKFFLRSTKAGSQAEYVGPTYTDRTSCGNSAISVYKFALLTPIALD